MLPAEEAETFPARARLPAEFSRLRSEKSVPDGAAKLFRRFEFRTGGTGMAEGFRCCCAFFSELPYRAGEFIRNGFSPFPPETERAFLRLVFPEQFGHPASGGQFPAQRFVLPAQLLEARDSFRIRIVRCGEGGELLPERGELLFRPGGEKAHLPERGELVGQKFEAEFRVFTVIPDRARRGQKQPERFEFQFALRQFPIGIGEEVAVEPRGPFRLDLEFTEIDGIGAAFAVGDDGKFQVLPLAAHPVDAEHAFDRSGDRLGGGEFAAEFRSREVAGIHAGEHSGAGPQVDTRFPRRGGDAQHQRLFAPVGPDSGKSGEVETLSAGVEPRIDLK